MKWKLNVELTHKGWDVPIYKTLHFEGTLEDVLDKIKSDMEGRTQPSDIWNLRKNRSTAFRDINGVTHHWRLEEQAF